MLPRPLSLGVIEGGRKERDRVHRTRRKLPGVFVPLIIANLLRVGFAIPALRDRLF